MAKQLKLEAYQGSMMFIVIVYAKACGMVAYSQNKKISVLREAIH
jgi:putative methionine-R-sulfoxide reductase with GAF domain